MRLRPYKHRFDFEQIRNWSTDRRVHALWCADRMSFPLEKDNMASVLDEMFGKTGDCPFTATEDDGTVVGFICCSVNSENNEAMLKFVMVDPARRKQGLGRQMLELAVRYCFDILNADMVHLNVFTANEAAKRCYESVGFKERNTEPGAFTFENESWGRCNMFIKKEKKKKRSDLMEKQYDGKALFKIGYGLYVITSNDGTKDNGMICNTVTQVASSPDRIAVAINKANYSHDVIKRTGFMNVNCLTEEASFDIFRQFGFKSGRDTDKFEGEQVFHTANGAAILTKFINSFISLKVTDYIDTGSHGLFICELTDAAVINDKPSMTYAFYHANVKPKPQPKKTKGFVCKICGYIYEGETLPEDYVCPICKHPASDFEPIE